MNHSIITEYQEDIQLSPAALTSQYQISKSPQRQEDLYSNRLEAKVKQLKNSIKKNKPLIDQLKSQRKFLKKIYQKQRQKIQGTKIQLVRNQYQSEIQQLRMQRHKLQDVITVIHDQSSIKARDFIQAKQQINLNYMQLSKALLEVKKQNQSYQQMLISKTQVMDLKKKLIQQLEMEIRGKLNVQRKYKQVIQQIQSIESQKKFK